MLCLIGRAAKQEAGANPGFLFFKPYPRNSTAQAEAFCRNILRFYLTRLCFPVD